jgi:hypothetical protein
MSYVSSKVFRLAELTIKLCSLIVFAIFSSSSMTERVSYFLCLAKFLSFLSIYKMLKIPAFIKSGKKTSILEILSTISNSSSKLWKVVQREIVLTIASIGSFANSFCIKL